MRTRSWHSKLLPPAIALVLVAGAGAVLIVRADSGAQALPKDPPRSTLEAHSTAVKSRPSAVDHHPVFGVSDPDLVNESADEQAVQYARMRSIGIDSVRFDADWAWVQFGGPDSYDWTQLDTEVHLARAAGLGVDLVVDGCPTWAAPEDEPTATSPRPASARKFSVWAAEVAARYAPDGVNEFEIWNEPNLADRFEPRANPKFYERMLADSYTAIKKVDHSAFVIAGGLAPVSTRGGNLSMIAFLRGIYEHGAKPYFNAVAVHPYSYPALPGTYEPWSAWSQMSETSPSIRSVMRQYGDGAKPVWITEYGVRSNRPGGLAVQAAALKLAISITKSTGWIGALYIYSWQDDGNGQTEGFGLVATDGKAKPAYTAVKTAIRHAG